MKSKQVAGPKHPFSDFGVAGPDRGSYFYFIQNLKKKCGIANTNII
jgi:hypothetical protein